MYRHTQYAPFLWFALPIGCFLIALPYWIESSNDLKIPCWTVAVLQGIGFWWFLSLTTQDEGKNLVFWFGRIPLRVKRIPYNQIVDFAADRSGLWDGWGVHYNLVKGWIYNIWGRDCVRLTLKGRREGRTKTIRIGTDDVPGLLALLHARTAISDETPQAEASSSLERL